MTSTSTPTSRPSTTDGGHPAPPARPVTGRLRALVPRSGFGVVVLVVASVFAVVMIYPLAKLVIDQFAAEGRLTLDPFRQALELNGIGQTLVNTLVVVGGSTVLATVVAAVFAWLNERTDARMGFIAEIMPLTPLLVPAIAGTVGWVFLLAPRSGIVNVLLRDVFGVFGVQIDDGPVNLFTLWGLIFLYTLLLVPYVYLPISAALTRLDPALEEASRVSGIGPVRSFVRVTIPAIKPAVANGVLLAFVIGLATFSVPVIVGTSAKIDILSVRIYSLMTFSYPPDIAPAVALSVVMVAVILLLSMVQRRLLRSGAYATIGGRGIRATQVRLGWWRWIARAVMVGFVLCASVIPLIGLVYVSLRGFWTPKLTLEGLSLNNYHEVLFNREITKEALRYSILLAAGGALLGMAVATLLAIYTGIRSGTGARLVDTLAKLPGALPHLVLAVAFLAALSGPPLRLSGTVLLLLLAYVVLFVPQAYLAAGAAYNQISTELSEASAVSGARPARTFLKITLPLMMPGLAGGAAVLFVMITGEVTASALLSGTNTPVIGFVILDLWTDGTFPMIAALGTVMTIITAMVTALLLYFGKGRASLRL